MRVNEGAARYYSCREEALGNVAESRETSPRDGQYGPYWPKNRIVSVLYSYCIQIRQYALRSGKKFPLGECVDGVNNTQWLSGLGMTALYSTAMVRWDDDIEW